MFHQISEKYKAIQASICTSLEACDRTGIFSDDPWERSIGKGMTRVMQRGEKIAKAAVNYSSVQGLYNDELSKVGGSKGTFYQATGISSIVHPVNPYSPIIHFNIRYFQLSSGECWFGGGIDLTPHYVDEREAIWFHSRLKSICDAYHPSFYHDFKTEADNYFYSPHRDETRGVGGIFFDMLKPSNDLTFNDLLEFTLDLGKNYAPIYNSIITKNHTKPYGNRELMWQNIRRGRYVEFNLIHDRGTKFGLLSGGNCESILVSLPPMASWEYNFQVEKFSEEENTLNMLKKGIDWVNLPRYE